MNFEERIANARKVALFLDFDGTLAPIVPRPGDAEMLPGSWLALSILSQNSRYQIAFVSGRALRDLQEKAGFPGAIYAGNHGLEIEGPGLHFEAKPDPLLREAVNRLRQATSGINGVEMEDKGLSASVHFRRVPLEEWAQVEAAVRQSVPAPLRIKPGKMVFEIRPPDDWNKGSAVRWIIDQRHWEDVCPVYIGDDVTDEDAFAAIPEGITIHVGSQPDTIAKYTMADTAEVADFLTRLANGQ